MKRIKKYADHEIMNPTLDRPMTLRRVAGILIGGIIVGWLHMGVSVWAQDFPIRAVRVVLPFAPGGGTDILARAWGQRMQELTGQSFVVDNRAGAGGNIGAELVARSANDGYTVLFTTSAIAANVSLYPKSTFDPRKDLIAVTQIGSAPSLLTVHPSVPVKKVPDLVALSKVTRGGLNFGSNGVGTSSHLVGIMFQQVTGAKMTHIAYKGAAPAINAVMSGETEIAFPGVNSAAPFLRLGKIRGIAVSTKLPSSALPQVPTLDSFYPGFDNANWFVLFVPTATPAFIVARFYNETVKSLRHPEMKKFMAREGADVVGSSPAEASQFFINEVNKLGAIIKIAGIKAE
jgi:tripartite-type tricarboxylate transporter receptor subunit TctC